MDVIITSDGNIVLQDSYAVALPTTKQITLADNLRFSVDVKSSLLETGSAAFFNQNYFISVPNKNDSYSVLNIVNVKSNNLATTRYKVYFGTRANTTSLFVATVDFNTSKTTWVSTDYKKLTFYSTEGKSSATLDLSDTNNWLGFFGLNKVTETVI